ncbi:hypothetical protein HNR50_003195 [Spirochaeta isovalerica]|uniref:Uncharacterized protein n=1 Tax=Spirochaeta isovalerica TaxID=150 RepID=A0A841RC09_9SPIO|nr:hypothetical protein [Spirochaeta isovalerica]
MKEYDKENYKYEMTMDYVPEDINTLFFVAFS